MVAINSIFMIAMSVQRQRVSRSDFLFMRNEPRPVLRSLPNVHNASVGRCQCTYLMWVGSAQDGTDKTDVYPKYTADVANKIISRETSANHSSSRLRWGGVENVQDVSDR